MSSACTQRALFFVEEGSGMKKQNAYRSDSVLWEMIVSLRMQNAK